VRLESRFRCLHPHPVLPFYKEKREFTQNGLTRVGFFAQRKKL
jgi:hypothetical protein